MKELIESIAQHSGITEESAIKALKTVSQFIKEQYPLLTDTIDSVLGTGNPSHN